MRSKDRDFFTPIAAHLNRELEWLAPQTVISTADVNMNGLVMAAMTVKSEGIHEPKLCFVRRNGSIETGMATTASEKTFAKVGVAAPESEPGKLVEAVAQDAITLDLTRRITSAAEMLPHGQADFGDTDPRMLGFAARVVRTLHPDMEISLPAGGDSVRAGNFTADKLDGEWSCGKRRLSRPLNAVIFVAASDAAERVAATYVHPVAAMSSEGVTLQTSQEPALVK